MPRLITTTKEANMAKTKTNETTTSAQAQPDATEAAVDPTQAARALQVGVKRMTPTAQMPDYATSGAACFDLRADIDEPLGISVEPGHSVDFPTGLAFDIPAGFCMLVFSRSGHGFRNAVRLANCVGVIDSDYVGEVRVKLTNDGRRALSVRPGDRIAQAMIMPTFVVGLVEVDELKTTERGAAGFGSTGA